MKVYDLQNDPCSVQYAPYGKTSTTWSFIIHWTHYPSVSVQAKMEPCEIPCVRKAV